MSGHDDAYDGADEGAPRARESQISPRPRTVSQPVSTNDTGRRSRFEGLALQRAADAAEGRLVPPAADEVLSVVLELNRTVGVEMQDEAIVHGYVTALRELFPRRRIAVRLISPETGQLTLVYATGRLLPERRETIASSDEARERHELTLAEVERVGARATEHYEPVFEEPGAGFDIPLIQGGRLAGAVCVEYEPSLEEPGFDRSLIVPLVVQLSSVLRNSRLLRESNYLRGNLEKLLDHANAPIVVLGRERELRVVNRAFLALTGSPREELLGKDFLQLIPDAERGRILPVFIRALRGEPTSNFELRLPRAGGGVARLVINTASVLASDGEIDAVIAIGRDLTELRELEGQVIQAEKLATLGQLAAGVVHELNNPLTSISVYGEYLLRKSQRAGHEPSDVEKMRRIVDSADRILKFTRDLVTYARPTTEEPAFVPVRDIVEQALLFCEHVISEVSANVVRRYQCEGARVYAVKGQLHQVFINLITNACHALPPSGGELILSALCQDGGQICITVEDNGPGIPTAVREKVFEPFYSTKGEGKGTGLGLSIVRNIVEQHSGTIGVRERDGGGTIFEICLPGNTP